MIVGATCLHKRAQIFSEFLERRPPYKPPSIIDRVDREVGSQGKSIGKCNQPVSEIRRGHFHYIELPDGLTLVVTEKRIGRSQTGTERRADLGRVGAYDGQLTVVDLQVFLQFEEAPQLQRAFRSPIATVKAHDQRKLAREFRQLGQLLSMIGERQIRESFAHNKIGMH